MDFLIGANPNFGENIHFSNIVVDNALIYNRALTEEEINKNYEIDKERFGI